MNYELFVEATHGTRRPSDFALDLAAETPTKEYADFVKSVREHASTINERGRAVPPCIYAALGDDPADTSDLVLIEGHARAVGEPHRNLRQDPSSHS